MTTLREAAEMALKALIEYEEHEEQEYGFHRKMAEIDALGGTPPAIVALRAALAEPVVLRTPEECIDILLQRMSVSDLAHAIGVDPSAISHAKAGRARITHYAAVDKLRSLV